MTETAGQPCKTSPDARSSEEPARAAVPTWSSEQLLAGSKEAHIVHAGEVYRLLRTRNQKLILVK